MFVFLFGLVLNLFVSQSTFTVVGSVRDQTGRTVSGVRLSVIDENFQPIRTLFIDTSGQFTIRGLGQGKFTFRIETTGTPYQEQTQQIELQALRRLGGNETFQLDFILKFKKGNVPPAATGSVFAQDVPQAARKAFDRGIDNLKGAKSDQAIASLKKAVEIFPDYYDALELLGTEYVKNAQFDSALPILTHALEVNKRGFRSLYGLGVANLKLNHLQEAIDWLEKAAQLEPASANAQMMLGLAYGSGGAFDKSEAAFKRAIQLGGAAAAEAHFYLAALYNKQERYAEARQEMEVYLREARNLKDPAQIKAMIEKLREKELAVASQPKATEPPVTDHSTQSASPGAIPSVGPAEPTTEPAPAALENKPRVHVAAPPLSPEMKELLHQSELNGGTMSRKLLDFTYTLKKTRRILNERGNSSAAQEHVFEAYPIKGEHVLILLSRDGIASKTVANERSRAAKELMEAERRKEKTDRPAGDSKEEPGDYVSAGVFGIQGGKPAHISINVSAFLRHCEFFSPRVETLDDRPAVALNFRPRFGVELPRNYSYINKMVGTVWIDREDRIVVRLEGWPDAEGAFDFAQSIAPRDEASLIYQQERLAGGVWFPKMIRMNAEGRPELFGGLNWDVVFQFEKYQQFNTQADDIKIKTPAKNP